MAILGAGVGSAFGQSTLAPEAFTAAPSAVAVREPSSRLPLLTRGDMTDDAGARIYDALADADDGQPRGALAIALHSPAIGEQIGRIERYLRSDSALPPHLREIFWLVTAREMSLAYEWSVHEPAALLAGVSPRTIDAVRNDARLDALESLDALAVDFGRQLFRNRHVDSATFATLVEQLGRRGAFDAMMTLAYPAMAGILQRAADLSPPADWDADALPELRGVGTPAGLPGDFVALGPRPPLAADVYEDSYYRWPLLRRDELDARGREIFDQLVGADRDTAPRGPVGMTLNSPELADPIQQLNALLRTGGALDRRLAEIVVTATGREMNSQYQWIVHGAAAEQAGASAEVLEALRVDGSLSQLDERDAAAIALTRELFRERAVRPETLDAAMKLFGARGVVEIAALAGDYLMMTTVYNALGMRLRADQEPTLPHRAGAPVGAEWR